MGAEVRVGGYARCVCNMNVPRCPRVAPYMRLNNSLSSRIVRTGGGDCLRLPCIARSLVRAIVSPLRRAVTWARCSRPRTSAVLRSVSMRPNVTGRSPIASASHFYLRSVERNIRVSRTVSSLPQRRDSSRCSREGRRSSRTTRVRIIFVVIVSL